METGGALSNDQGSDPKMLMSASNDGGRTFDNNRELDIGAIGEFRQRLIWTVLGRTAREKMLAFEMSEPIKFTVKRSKWLRGVGGKISKLFRYDTRCWRCLRKRDRSYRSTSPSIDRGQSADIRGLRLLATKIDQAQH